MNSNIELTQAQQPEASLKNNHDQNPIYYVVVGSGVAVPWLPI